MKTVINAKIIFETDHYQDLYFTGDIGHEILTIRKMAEALKYGHYQLTEVLTNELMRDAEITLVVKHVLPPMPPVDTSCTSAVPPFRILLLP